MTELEQKQLIAEYLLDRCSDELAKNDLSGVIYKMKRVLMPRSNMYSEILKEIFNTSTLELTLNKPLRYCFDHFKGLTKVSFEQGWFDTANNWGADIQFRCCPDIKTLDFSNVLIQSEDDLVKFLHCVKFMDKGVYRGTVIVPSNFNEKFKQANDKSKIQSLLSYIHNWGTFNNIILPISKKEFLKLMFQTLEGKRLSKSQIQSSIEGKVELEDGTTFKNGKALYGEVIASESPNLDPNFTMYRARYSDYAFILNGNADNKKPFPSTGWRRKGYIMGTACPVFFKDPSEAKAFGISPHELYKASLTDAEKNMDNFIKIKTENGATCYIQKRLERMVKPNCIIK